MPRFAPYHFSSVVIATCRVLLLTPRACTHSTTSATPSSLAMYAQMAINGEFDQLVWLRGSVTPRIQQSPDGTQYAKVRFHCSIFGHFCPRGPTCGRERCSFDDSVSSDRQKGRLGKRHEPARTADHAAIFSCLSSPR